MSVFGFIENFFFISLGIAFALVLLLVYHFKNRMSVAEKKSETMYGLISSVVKEIKSLRTMFGLGGGASTPTVEPTQTQSVKKSEPEIDVRVSDSPAVVHVDLASPPSEVAQKIVVSDNDDEYSESDEDYSDSESEDDELSVVSVEHESSVNPEVEPISIVDLELESQDVLETEALGVEEVQCIESQEAEVQCIESQEAEVQEAEVQEAEVQEAESQGIESQEVVSDPPKESHSAPVAQEKHSIDQLRKMNINQLKTIAIQSGISVDTSKLKKHDLITLILG